MDSLSVIILAAGLSRRMGDTNKLLISVDGEPLVRRTAVLYRSLFSSVTVITGFEHVLVHTALLGLDVKIIVNPDFEKGQQSSARRGLKAQELSNEGVIIALADQPKFNVSDILYLAQNFLESDKSKVFVPYVGSQRGNPIIFPSALIRKMREQGKTIGCRKFIQNNPEHIHKFSVPNDAFITDLDTPQDAIRYGYLTLLPGGASSQKTSSIT